ncbi:hypothetical protein [Blastopirellula retiformator]|uniref:Uncharacterized protein n=1 Tax=Blastopirellula retiformator TaxID=2527970 RepID=A0A5C5VLA2_9BACT|nr:hypothetical protein [Blastopirellula retiformator]TWT38595.1 hypothetical protein Enr8_02880 [Blastopirellula retiformator]
MDKPYSVRSYLRAGAIVIVLAFILIYLGTFLYLSRTGMQTAEEYGWDFYYFTEPTWSAERQQTGETLCALYWPLIELDARMVSGLRARAVQPVRLIDDPQGPPASNPIRLQRAPVSPVPKN